MSTFSRAPARPDRIPVLELDSDLARRLSGARLQRARMAGFARILERDAGSWDAGRDAAPASDGLGLLVIDGVLVRRVGLDGRYAAEVLGPGDVLRPWEHDGDTAVLPFEPVWRALRPLRLAVLDLQWAERMSPYPEVMAELLARSLRRSLRLAAMLVISQQPRLEEALLRCLWELADRFGRVRPDGTHVELELTHELVGYLVGARRPSISTALKRLETARKLRREGRTFVLLGDPPSGWRP